MNPNIGNKIKQLREEHQLSLAELAANASIYPMQLEKIESSETSLPWRLWSVSPCARHPRGTILDGEEHYEPVVQLSTDRTPSINLVESENLGSHLRFSALAQNKTDRNMEPFFINVSYCPTGDLPSHHEGEEFLYVLEGSVQLLYGQETYTLEKGDSIYYDSIVPHNLTTLAEGETAKVLAVTYTPF